MLKIFRQKTLLQAKIFAYIRDVKHFAKLIREKTGLSITEFCKNELNSEYKAFLARLRNGNLKPNEVIYIIMRTGKAPEDLFDKSLEDLFYFRGDQSVTERIKHLIDTLSKEERQAYEQLFDFNLFNTQQAQSKTKAVSPKKIVEEEIITEEDQAPTEEESVEDIFIETYHEQDL